MSFSKIITQPKVTAAIRQAYENDHLAHALLFQGPAGSGQTEVAKETAKLLFCEKKEGGESCDVCSNCRLVDQGAHPDLYVLRPEEGANVIKVEEVRFLISRSSFKPFQAIAKVFLIERAECLNDVAQNALLKTLEEPQGRTYFILTTAHSDRLLITVRSRLQTFHFAPAADTAEWAPEITVLKNEVIQFSMNDSFSKAPPDLAASDRAEAARILDAAIAYVRDVLVIRAGVPEIAVEEAMLDKKKYAQRFSPAELEDKIEALALAKDRVLHNINLKLISATLWQDLEKKYAG